MKLFKQSLLAALLALGVTFTCTAQTAQLTPTQEHTQKISRAFAEADKLRQSSPREALALLEEVLKEDLPPFDKSNPDPANQSYELYRSEARLYFEAARAADEGGYWEKSVEYHKKSAEVINDAVAQTREAFTLFIQYHEEQNKTWQAILNANAEEIERLKAKDEKDYTEEERDSLEKLASWERDINSNKVAIEFFSDRIKAAEAEAAFYNPTPSRADAKLDIIQQQQESIDSHSGGDKDRWVEGIVYAYATYFQNFSTGEKISFTYRLMELSPESKLAPALLDFLQEKITKAEFDKILQAARRNRPPVRK